MAGFPSRLYHCFNYWAAMVPAGLRLSHIIIVVVNR